MNGVKGKLSLLSNRQFREEYIDHAAGQIIVAMYNLYI